MTQLATRKLLDIPSNRTDKYGKQSAKYSCVIDCKKFNKDFLNVNRGEWLSGLTRCSKNRKVHGSNPTRHSVGFRESTSLRSSRCPWVENVKRND